MDSMMFFGLSRRWMSFAMLTAGMTLGGMSAAAVADTLRLSTTGPPDDSQTIFAQEFAKRVVERTNGEIEIKVFPSSQLGDWVEIHELMMEGAVDMAVQPLSNSFNEVLALQWFPYSVTTFAAGQKAFSPGGTVYEVVNGAIGEQDLKILGAYVSGAGGLLYSNPPEDPKDINISQNRKIRVWPGGTTHQKLLERTGHQTVPVPWAEAYTAMQTGVVDGLIGSTAELTLANFADVTKMWVQNNDHFEVSFININKTRFEGLSSDNQAAIAAVASEMSSERFGIAESEQDRFLQKLRDIGVDVIVLSDAEIEDIARTVRTEVWPEIAGEIGAENMEKLLGSLQ